jgi:hypothetical protein
MSKDRYSDDHTIETLGEESNLTIHTGGADSAIILEAGDPVYPSPVGNSSIKLNAEDHIALHADSWITSRAEIMRFRTREDGNNPSNIPGDGTLLVGDLSLESTRNLNLYADGDVNINSADEVNITTTTAEKWIKLRSHGVVIRNGSDDDEGDDRSNNTALLVRNYVATGSYIAKFQTGAENVWKTRITTGGQVQCKSLKIEEGAAPGYFLQSDVNGVASWSNNLGSDVIDWSNISADKIGFHAGYLGLELNTLAASSGIVLHSGDAVYINTADDEATVITGNSSGYVLEVKNENTGTQADGIKIDLKVADPDPTNNWMRFTANGSDRGCIQGSGGMASYFAIPYNTDVIQPFVGKVTSVGIGALPDVEYTPDSGTAMAGGVMFVSGSHDFGEFIEAGDIDEWPEVNRKTWKLGLPEGCVVWVDNSKFYKENKGTSTPMVVTDRPVVVGNGLPVIKDSGVDSIGEVLSFIGQLPVFIEGPSKNGDLIIPVANESFCRCISKEEITFQEYMSAVGTAWEDREDPGENTLHRVMCAIGKK